MKSLNKNPGVRRKYLEAVQLQKMFLEKKRNATGLLFSSFLTVAQKYSYNCVYIFHSIYAEKATWRTILSQTNIYNIFPATVPFNSVKKILEGTCIQKTSKYIPQSTLCISRLFIELAKRNEKVCLTIDCSNTNRDGPGRFRTETGRFRIFPATVPFNSVKKILEGACIQKTSKYILQSTLCISRLFIELTNRNKKVCLTIDCSNTNRDGPGRFRTEADNPDFQACYFNSANDEQVYNEFVSQRIKTLSDKNNFQFEIIELKS